MFFNDDDDDDDDDDVVVVVRVGCNVVFEKNVAVTYRLTPCSRSTFLPTTITSMCCLKNICCCCCCALVGCKSVCALKNLVLCCLLGFAFRNTPFEFSEENEAKVAQIMAKILDVPQVHVYEVATFYTMYNR
jgi:hypothetical protein